VKNRIIAILILSLMLSVLVPMLTPGKGQADFIAYWSASTLFSRGENPYNPIDMLKIQREIDARHTKNTDLVLNAWNPPWLILLLVPLGLLPFDIAANIWIFINLLVVGFALLLTWEIAAIHNGKRGFQVVLVAGYLFIQTIVMLSMGQVSSLVLLSVVLSVWLMKNSKDWLAGSALLFTTIKPHLSYFFLLVVFIWIIQNRRWKIVGGMVLTMSFTLTIFFILLPGWPGDYITLIHSMPYSLIYTSTVGSLMDALLGTKLFYFSAFLVLFLIRPLLNLIRNEGWLVPTNFSLLVGIPLSPFGFLFDQVLLLPAIIQIVAWILNKDLRGGKAILISAGIILVNIGTLALATSIIEQYYFLYVWVPFAVLAVYFVAWKKRYVQPA
jgi:hypothetical protein